MINKKLKNSLHEIDIYSRENRFISKLLGQLFLKFIDKKKRKLINSLKKVKLIAKPKVNIRELNILATTIENINRNKLYDAFL